MSSFIKSPLQQKTIVVRQTLSKTTKLIRTQRTPRSPTSNVVDHTNSDSTGGGGGAAIATKSKYTERKTMLAPYRSRSQRLDQQTTIATANKQHLPLSPLKTERRPIIQPVTPKPKLWGRKDTKQRLSNTKLNEKVEPPHMEIGIQTNEPEILNRDLLIGDIKFLLPSKLLVTTIDRERLDAKKKAMLKVQRKFEEHAEKQEEHLTDLKEFLEKAVVTKRARKPKEPLEIDRKLISSMDELLNREVHRSESITDIKSRIKKKEKELMSLFETVENIQILSNKN